MFQVNFDTRPIAAERKTFGPFDDHDGFFCQGVLKPERFEVVEIFDAIEVDVIDLERMRVRTGGRGEGFWNRWTSVNVGLVMSSSRAAPRPLMIPLVSVVFPAPRSPLSRTSTGGESFSAISLPLATVSS